MSAVILTSESLAVSVHPGHGAVIDSISFRGGPNLLWETPGANLHDLTGDLGEAGEASIATFDLGILAGGWFPMFPTVGPPGSSQEVWMHGEAARIPWAIAASDDGNLVMTGRTRDFDLVREVSLSENAVRVRMSATNRASDTRDVAGGEHPCFRRDLFAGGILRVDPVRATTGSIADRVAHRLAESRSITWPITRDASGRTIDLSEVPTDPDGRHDHVSLTLAEGMASLTSPLLGVRVVLDWSADVLPFAMLWQHFLPPTSPWNGDVFALEPATTPWRLDSETRENDNLVCVEAGGTLSYSLAIELASLDPQ